MFTQISQFKKAISQCRDKMKFYRDIIDEENLKFAPNPVLIGMWKDKYLVICKRKNLLQAQLSRFIEMNRLH